MSNWVHGHNRKGNTTPTWRSCRIEAVGWLVRSQGWLRSAVAQALGITVVNVDYALRHTK